MITSGVDIGSVTAKAVILDGKKVLVQTICPTGAHPKSAAEKVLEEALKQASLSSTDIGYTVSTGYGRRTVEFGDRVITEISAAAKGASHLGSPWGKVRTVIDLGGQDSKVISLDEEGEVVDFVMNDKCAAGTGRFLEVMAGVLEVNLESLGELSLRSKNPIRINSTCTVFAESEVVSLIAQGKKKEDIIAGIHSSIAERIVNMTRQISEKEAISFAGGGAKNRGIHKALEDKFRLKVYVPDEPQFVIALGAALIAKNILSREGAS